MKKTKNSVSPTAFAVGNEEYKVFFDFNVDDDKVELEAVASRAIEGQEERVDYVLEEIVVRKSEAVDAAEQLLAHIINTLVENRVPYTAQIHFATRAFVQHLNHSCE